MSTTEIVTAEMQAAIDAYQSIPFSPLVPARPTGKQMAFLANMKREALYGGTARSMKSWAALMAALQFACVPGYSAIIFRKERISLELPDGLIDIAAAWLEGKAHWSADKYRWTFPSGATLSFGYLSERKDLMKYHSSAYQFILFEEIAEWPTDTEYSYMFSRCTPKVDFDKQMKRCECHNWCVADVPIRVRATANPGGPGQSWVRQNFIIPHREGQPGIFHPASYLDNPFLNHREYEDTVAKMKAIDRARILGGDWDISAPGDRFSRDWFKPMTKIEFQQLQRDPSTKCIRRWDMAGTKVKKTNKDPDFTAGVLVFHREVQGGDQWVIADVEEFRATAGSVIARIKTVSKVDDKRYKRHIPIRVEREPGVQARMAMQKVKQDHFKGYNFRAISSRMRKEDRIDVLAVEAEVGNESQDEQVGVFIVEGSTWRERFLDQAETYGNPGVHDDMIDGASGAMLDLSRGAGSRKGQRHRSDADADGEGGEPDRAESRFGYAKFEPSDGPRTRSASGMSGGYADFL